MAIQRWDPFRDLRDMDETINRLWRGFGGGAATRQGSEEWNILFDVIEKKDQIIVKASLPGVKPADIDVSFEENTLTLKAECKPEDEGKDAEYLIQERPTGSFFRSLRLPDIINADKIQSNYENGILTITMPKAEEKKKKQIKVNVTGQPKTIEAAKK